VSNCLRDFLVNYGWSCGENFAKIFIERTGSKPFISDYEHFRWQIAGDHACFAIAGPRGQRT
jgi:hypothetical protein